MSEHGVVTAVDAGAGISVRGLSKSYGSHQVLRDVSTDIRQGCVTGLLGPNGSGKTTLLRIVLGLERPSAGGAVVLGRPLRDHPVPLRTLGALLDAGWVHPRRTAAAHLRWIAQASAISTRRVDEVLAEVGLQDVAGTAVGTFSLGMRQRLGIASTLLGDPAVLVYDEPLNGLDHSGVAWVREFVVRQAAAGRTVLLSSHLLSEIEITADRVVVLGRGGLLFDGPVREVLGGGGGVEAEIDLGAPGPEPDLAALTAALGRRGGRCELTPTRRGSTLLRVDGLPLSDVAGVLTAAGVRLRRIEEQGSLEDAYARLTASSVEYAGAGGERS